jgi:hypothetical protein
MRNGVMKIVREHNSLNGLRLVTVEFLLVAVAAGWICAGEALHYEWLGAIAGAGIAVNGLAVMIIGVLQLRSGDENIGIVKAGSKEYRSRIAREHPGLSGNTVRVMLLVMVPFLLVGRLAWESRKG